MKTVVRCYVCRRDLEVLDTKSNRKSTVYFVGWCGHCETMAAKTRKDILENQDLVDALIKESNRDG